MFFKALALVCVAGAASAECPIDAQTLLVCDIADSNKHLQTCLDGDTVTYAFGVKGKAADLSLTRNVREVDVVPWPGVGRWIWGEFTLANAGYAYSVHYAFERNPDAMNLAAGVAVFQGETELRTFICDADTLDFSGFPSPVFDAKTTAGQSWDFDAKRWVDAE